MAENYYPFGKVFKDGSFRLDGILTKHEELRRELWIKVAVAVAAAMGCTDKYAPQAWANVALEAFDAKFKDDNAQ